MAKLKPEERLRVLVRGIEFELEVAEEGGYVVRVPTYPSCVTQGETFEEAIENVEDALLGCILAAKDLKLAVPPELEQWARAQGENL
jgi:antitoxin HicB